MAQIWLIEPIDIVKEEIKMRVVSNCESQDAIKCLHETLGGLTRTKNVLIELLVLG